MTDKQLRYILTVAEEGSITRASGKLNITQPSLSALVSNVEEELGLKLFNRDSIMGLTYAGECYVDAARKILDILYELQSRIRDIKDEDEGRLSLGCSQQFSSIILPVVIPLFYKWHPKSQIRMTEANTSTLEKLIMSDDIDLGFTGAPIQNDQIDHIRLYDEEVVLFTPQNYRPRLKQDVKGRDFPFCDLSDLNGKPFVLFEQGRHMRYIANRIFADFNIKPQVFFETNDWHTCSRMVEEGLAFTFLPHSVLTMYEEGKKMKKFSLPGKYKRQVAIYFKKRSYQSRLMQNFLETSQKIFAEMLQEGHSIKT